METFNINGHILEYVDDTHTYLCDGIVVPSVTSIIGSKFKDKYKNVDPLVLKRASIKGTNVHKAIEEYCKNGTDSDMDELYNFKYLQKVNKFSVKDNEVPVIIFLDNKAVATGRLDLVLEQDGKLRLADIKTTSTLDKEYLKLQLNLYRIGYQQCYGKSIEGLNGLHLRGNTRKFVNIPIDEESALNVLKTYYNEVV